MMPGKLWTHEEIEILNEYYPIQGSSLSKTLLPNRSIQSINYKAYNLKIRKKKQPFIERFWQYVFRYKESRCWLWIGAKDARGYGVFSVDNRACKAHRLMFEIYNKILLTNNLDIHHDCNNKLCVNPDHLIPLTKSEHTKLHKCVALYSTVKQVD